MKKLKLKKINFSKIKPRKKLVNKEKEEKSIKVKDKRIRKKSSRKNIWYIILIAFISLCILGIISMIGFFIYIAKTAPEFDQKLLYEKESTLVYDMNGNLIATLGVEKREKLTYDELPEVLIDAIVATEDARFFQHNGFDLPRFLKASFGQFLGKSDSGGASTITMQISKRAFTDTTSTGIKGIIRKFTDIYMSIFKIEKHYTKKEILEFYVNSPFMGPGAYGVEQASRKYFGKSASDLSLTEAALIAGLYQAPNSYNPFVNPKDATERRNTVLYLMERHGYITKEQREDASSIKIENIIVNYSESTANPYQGFIETAIAEAREITETDPYTVPMAIYTTLDPAKQDVVNSIYNGSSGFKFKDDVIQFATTVLDNKTGAIVAIGTGRNRKGEMELNYAAADEIRRHPGSTAKPILDYGPGFEYEKWSTYTPFFDEKNTTYSNGIVMNNFNGANAGFSTLRRCLVDSVNTCALQAFQRLDKQKVYEFATSLGIQPEMSDGVLHEAHSIGAFTGVNTLDLAAAYSAFANGGYYSKPYSISKIEYRDSGDIYEHEVVKKKVMSDQTSYLISNVLMGVTPWTVRVSGTQVATKTGTSSYDNDKLAELGLSRSIIPDSWVATYSPDITITLWLGYDKLTKEYNITMNEATAARTRIQGILCNGIMPPNAKFASPGGIISTNVEMGTIPAMLPSEYTPSDLIQTHLFIAGTEPTEVSFRFSNLSNPTDLKYTISDDKKTATFNWSSPGTPTAIDNEYLMNYFKNGYGKWAEKYLNQRISYNNNYIGTFGFEIYLLKGTTEKYIGFTDKTSYNITLSDYIGYDTVLVKSAYSIFKNNKSSGISKKFTDDSLTGAILSINIKDDKKEITLKTNDIWNSISNSDLVVKLNGDLITGYEVTLDINKIINISTGIGVAPENITKNSGIYEVTYYVDLIYLGNPFDRKIIKQTVVVNDSIISPTSSAT